VPKLREGAAEKVAFTIRYDAAVLARIDAYAERTGTTRAESTRAVLAAGLDAVEATVTRPSESDGLVEVLRRLDALAVAVAELPERVPPQVYRRKGKERREGPTRPDASIGRRDEDKPQP
jgi:hypothetical protein